MVTATRLAKARGPNINRARIAPFWTTFLLAFPWQVAALIGNFSLPVAPILIIVAIATVSITIVTMRCGIYKSRDQLILKGPLSQRLIDTRDIAAIRSRRVTFLRIYYEFRIVFELKTGEEIGFPWIGWHDFQSQLRGAGPGNTRSADALVESLNVAVGL